MGIQCGQPGWGSLPMTALSLIPCQMAAAWPFSECDFQDGQKYLYYTNHTLLPKGNACQFQGSRPTSSFVCCSFQTSHLPSVIEAVTSKSPFALSDTFHPWQQQLPYHTAAPSVLKPECYFLPSIYLLSKHLMNSLYGPGVAIG